MITGPSGVGKGTLIRTLLERIPELELSVSATTRRPRPGEEDGVAYHFLDDAEFERERQCVEPSTNLRHAGGVGGRQSKVRLDASNPFHEESDSWNPCQIRRSHCLCVGFQRERSDGVLSLTTHSEWGAARDQHSERWNRRQQVRDQRRGKGDQPDEGPAREPQARAARTGVDADEWDETPRRGGRATAGAAVLG